MGTEGTSGSVLLERLDELLAETEVNLEERVGSSGELLNDPAYTEKNKEYHKVTVQP